GGAGRYAAALLSALFPDAPACVAGIAPALSAGRDAPACPIAGGGPGTQAVTVHDSGACLLPHFVTGDGQAEPVAATGTGLGLRGHRNLGGADCGAAGRKPG